MYTIVFEKESVGCWLDGNTFNNGTEAYHHAFQMMAEHDFADSARVLTFDELVELINHGGLYNV